MNRLLITGATGFLGLPCVLRATTEFVVHAVARGGVCALPCGSRLTPHPCDLFDRDAVSRLLATVRPTHLLHLAWIATPGVYWTSPENQGWVEASKHLLTAFAECGGRRAVIAGTCAEYDWTAGGVCRERDTPLRPATLYGQCKNELREWCESESRLRRSLSLAWARLFHLYGPHEHPARLVPSVARALLAGEVAECSAGTQERDFLHTHDVADALISLVRSDVVGPVNIGSGEAVPVRSVVEAVARWCGRLDLVRLGARPTPPDEPPLLVAAVSRLRDEVGWRPRVTLEAGIRETVSWWRVARAA
jgi:nucleoside-diphosphate-sugar epimerase